MKKTKFPTTDQSQGQMGLVKILSFFLTSLNLKNGIQKETGASSILIFALCVCLSVPFTCTIYAIFYQYFCVMITQILVQTFTTRGKQQPIESPTFVS